MIKLKHYEVDSTAAVEYFQHVLENANTLSIELLKILNLKDGHFFSLLPDIVDLQMINNLRWGGLGIKEYKIKEHVELFILKKLKTRGICIFDNVADIFHANYKDELFLNYGLFYNNEIYYLITKNVASIQVLEECFYASNAIWHCLCILSDVNLTEKKEKKLTLQEITNISLNTKLITVRAYDGEGYVFWEPITK